MSFTSLTRATVTALAASVLCLSFSGMALAREGSSSKSIGKGIKCTNVVVRNADGTTTVTQVCRKGV